MSNSKQIVRISDDLEFSIDSFVTPGCYEGDLSCIVIPEGLVVDRVKKLAHEIHESLGDVPLILLCILKGSYKFFTTLVDELTIARRNCTTSLTVEFIRAKSYDGTASTGHLQIIGLESLDELKGQNVVIVEDIVDSGLTLHRLIKTVNDNGASNIWTAILLSKRVERTKEVPENFVAFSIPDKFIVGYGLDYNQKFRDLNHIAAMSKSGIAKYK
ncbi:Phosphoribosyltransferase domain and Hypoxanthine phosphoribosyl transferase family-containing protein [Strongyloides ratti]|uniref:Hypoxanthine phosphoribosyltransferase n=1 Tax=Strongyloides ratti TaxID=34506 RepID=A0A090L4K9_STRRB|nr:Phosphoribosyltransferase domain and Hypoxanthine phosphoribosyl transferase family-containing protein [Strongyloides ratti]CEF64701.1 Phosphoribosyltransferase domain and Hypoxanthine phosphoribosyl transferase family-containing protein [Strongyloides ratti]